MERRDSRLSLSFLLMLGTTVGAVLGVFTALFNINPFITLLPTKVPFDDQNLVIQKALERVVNNELKTDTTIPGLLLKKSEEVMARLLAQEVRILCLVMTNETHHRSRADHVKRTWGRHCGKLVFMSDANDDSLPGVDTAHESRPSSTWAKLIASLKHVWRKYRDDFDWVVKADDSNFLFVEDLQEVLLPYAPDEPLFFGFRLNPILPQGYMSDNAGWALSKETLFRLVNHAFDGREPRCPPRGTSEHPDDVQLGQCLAAVNAEAGDSRDWEGRNKFFPMDIETHTFVEPVKYKWFWSFTFWPANIGMEGMADKPVSFHYIKPSLMYVIEHLAFNVRPFMVKHLEVNTPVPTIAPLTTTTTKKP